jgi:soluble lytic murein transglycosylase-like protein
MALDLGPSSSRYHGLGLRHPGERRHDDRRHVRRRAPDRRRRQRRRNRMRSVLLAALALLVPHHTRSSAVKSVVARVSATIDSFDAVPPERAYDHLIAEASAQYHVDPHLIRSVMEAESAFDPFAVSRAGALGLMQLMPEIAKQYGVANPFDPRENVMAGTHILRELIDHHHGNVPLVLASYNAGAGVVADYGNVIPPFAETESYVKRVTGLIADARNAAP